MKKILTILPEELEESETGETEFPKFLTIYFIKENNEIKFNYFKGAEYSNNSNETVNRNGKDYLLLIYNTKNQIIDIIYFSPSNEPYFDFITIPNYLNLSKIELINAKNNQKENLDLSGLTICNENNICEPGEENLCPLDCKTAKNPNYPFSQPIKELVPITTQFKVVTKTTEKEIPLPSKIFSNIFLITLATIGAILVFVLIIYFIKRKK